MLLPISLLNSLVTVKRRQSSTRDILNNPVYGAPTSGSGWSTIYTNMPVRLAFHTNLLDFAREGERENPGGVVYYSPDYALQTEDRIITADGIEYTVISIVPGYVFGSVVDHYEAIVQLP